MISAALQSAAHEVFGCHVTQARRLHGGDLSDVLHIILQDARQVVAKQGPLTATEGRMLCAMAKIQAPVPKVLGHSDNTLFLEALQECSETSHGWRALGTGLQRLHSFEGPDYGWPEDYAFGSLRIDNTTTQDWTTFWGEHRLLSTAESIPGDLYRRVETLVKRLPDLLPEQPRRALLHGDLWGGNILFASDSAFLIDPACYHGHAEVDLSMLHLFGTPHAAFWEGYGGPQPGWRDRMPLYQLWPALVHLRLFGAGYRGMVETLLSRLRV